MTGGDLIVIAPWLVFAAGISMIGYRLLTHRRTRWPRHRPNTPPHRGGSPAGQSEPRSTGSASRDASR